MENLINSALNTTSQVKFAIKALERAGFEVRLDTRAGVVDCDSPELGLIFRGVKKGPAGQPWIVRFNTSVFNRLIVDLFH